MARYIIMSKLIASIRAPKKKLLRALAPLIVVAIVALLAGCVANVPQAMITNPKDGDTRPAGNIQVSVQVKNFNLVDKLGQEKVSGEGHIHYFMDVAPPTEEGERAVTAPGTYNATGSISYTWQNVAPGRHNFSVELVNNDHTPLSPPVINMVTITVIAVTPSPTPPIIPPPNASQNVTINLTAKSIAFDKKTITVPAGAHVTVNFDNQDSGITHNFAVYKNTAATETIFQGDRITGPKKTTYTFDAPTTPGTYFFRCDVHPTVMTGQVIVQ